MNYSNVADWIREKKQVVIVIALVVALVLTTTIISSAVTASEKTTDYYDIKLGGKTVATVKTKDDADKVIHGVKNYYNEEGDKVISVKCDPALTSEVHPCKNSEKAPKLEKNADKIVKHLVTGDVEEKKYTVEEGDTMWDVSGNLDVDIEELEKLNEGVDLEMVKPGDEINYQKSEPLVDVIMETEVTEKEDVPFDTETVSTDDLYEDQSQIKEYGVLGQNEVRAKVKFKNGYVVKRHVLDTKVIKEPKTQIEEKGTKKRTVATSSTSSTAATGSNGGSVAYGTPVNSGNGGSYLGSARGYMGTSYGAMNCYQFCAAVYGQYGQGVMDGTVIPFSQAKPGDLLVFDRHHYGIYAGGNSVIHSIMGNGVCCTDIGYVRRVNGGVAYAVSK